MEQSYKSQAHPRSPASQGGCPKRGAAPTFFALVQLVGVRGRGGQKGKKWPLCAGQGRAGQEQCEGTPPPPPRRTPAARKRRDTCIAINDINTHTLFAPAGSFLLTRSGGRGRGAVPNEPGSGEASGGGEARRERDTRQTLQALRAGLPAGGSCARRRGARSWRGGERRERAGEGGLVLVRRRCGGGRRVAALCSSPPRPPRSRVLSLQSQRSGSRGGQAAELSSLSTCRCFAGAWGA